MIRSAFATIGVLFLSLTAYAAPVGLGYAADYNVFTLGNLGGKGGFHIVGRVAVGGNVVGESYSFGDTAAFPKEWTAPASTSYYAYIAGTNSRSVNSTGPGDVYIGTPGSERVSANDWFGTKYNVYTGSPVSGYSSPVPGDAGHALINFGEAGKYLTALSQTIAKQSPTGTGSWDGDGRYTLTATKDTVFNLTAAEFAKLKSITTNGHSVIVNVTGESAIKYEGANNIRVDGNDTLSATANVLFNFRDATSIDLDDVLYGSILAPNADLDAMGNLKGQIIVKNLLRSGEIHAAAFTGPLPPVSTPEPSSLLLMGSGLFGMWGIRRRILRG